MHTVGGIEITGNDRIVITNTKIRDAAPAQFCRGIRRIANNVTTGCDAVKGVDHVRLWIAKISANKLGKAESRKPRRGVYASRLSHVCLHRRRKSFRNRDSMPRLRSVYLNMDRNFT